MPAFKGLKGPAHEKGPKFGIAWLQLEAAVDEVALERLKGTQEQSGHASSEEALPDPERIPIEAPRAKRSNSDISTSAP